MMGVFAKKVANATNQDFFRQRASWTFTAHHCLFLSLAMPRPAKHHQNTFTVKEEKQSPPSRWILPVEHEAV